MTEAARPDAAHPKHTHDAARLGVPRLHLRSCDSTNERARALALAGAPHGTLVSAEEQTAGRGRQGRSWVAPPGECLLCSLVLRFTDAPHPPALLPLIAGVAVCAAIGADALVKWPNDIVFAQPGTDGTLADQTRAGGGAAAQLAKVAGILVEGRPQEGWAVLGVGVNVALRLEDLPADVRARAATLGRPPGAIEPLLGDLLAALNARLDDPPARTLQAWRALDALAGREVAWAQPKGTGQGRGRGRAEGVDGEGRLLVRGEHGETTALSGGDVHLSSAG
jgi:BirA family transcriptional regulator, biotin operon repressor / biotin---[acetyl-CoA-carboxylase] ligase